MWTDPIVEELHRIREIHAAQFGNDLRAIVADLRELEAAWPAPKIDPAPQPAADPAVVPRGLIGTAGTPPGDSASHTES